MSIETALRSDAAIRGRRALAGTLALQRGKAMQAAVRKLYQDLGLYVVSFSQPGLPRGVRGRRGTFQTCGVPDLLIACPRLQRAWFHEVKAGTGRLSPYQRRFKETLDGCGVPVVVGGVDEAVAYLRQIGAVK